MRPASALLGAFTVLVLWTCQVGDVRARNQSGCHIAHWENWTSEDEDPPSHDCFDELAGSDLSTANAAISGISNSGYCATLKALLQNNPSALNEWTGYWYDGYWWDAATKGAYWAIGFHHSVLGDTGLWTHEAVHFDNNPSEVTADYYRHMCMLNRPGFARGRIS